MSSDAPALSAPTGRSFRIGVVAARYNPRLADALLGQVLAGLRRAGVKPGNIAVLRVPGSGELPAAAQGLIARRKPDALIALGVIIRGDTIHFELLAGSVAHALQSVSLAARTPVINGVIVAETPGQAAARASGRIDRGSEFALAALSMAALKRKGWR